MTIAIGIRLPSIDICYYVIWYIRKVCRAHDYTYVCKASTIYSKTLVNNILRIKGFSSLDIYTILKLSIVTIHLD